MVKRLVSPLLVESDLVSLSSGLEVNGSMLIDNFVGAKHQLTPAAREAIIKIKSPIRYDQWLTTMNAQGLVLDQQLELISFLNHIGGLQLKRAMKAWPQIVNTVLRSLILGVGLSRVVTWRRQATIRAVATATLRAMISLIVLSIVVAIISWSTGLISGWQGMQFLIAGLLLVWFSTVAHEYTHVLFVTGIGEPAIVLQQGLRLGIVHRRLDSRIEIESSLAGPVAGIVAAASLGYLATIVGFTPIIRWLGLLVAGLHAVSLMPWHGDGLTLLKLARGVAL